jgi:hypothetical protein
MDRLYKYFFAFLHELGNGALWWDTEILGVALADMLDRSWKRLS